MDNNYYVNLAESMKKYTGEQRQHLVSGYVYDTLDDDALTKMPAAFFAELLKNEKDPVCKWYEIKAIGELKATEYIDLLVSVLSDEDVKFETGSSLHLIAANSLGKMGEVAIPSIMKLFESGADSTRLAVIDTLGESRCSAGALAIKEMLSLFNLKEFNYAMLALAKCGAKGSEVLKSIYSGGVDTEKMLCVIDAMCYSSDCDNMLKEILYTNTDLVVNVLSAKTRGASLALERIVKECAPWTSADKDYIRQKGVAFNE